MFHKPTFSGRYLNFPSHHPLMHKRDVVMGLVDKVMLLSHPKFHKKNLIKIIEILLNNCYPLQFVFNIVRKRIKFLIYNDTTHNISDHDNKKRHFFTVSYVKNISKKFFSLEKIKRFKLSFTLNNKLNKFIKSDKDLLGLMEQCDVVYKISCQDCEASYVAQTKRKLKTRINEYRRDINNGSKSPSVISQHKLFPT